MFLVNIIFNYSACTPYLRFITAEDFIIIKEPKLQAFAFPIYFMTPPKNQHQTAQQLISYNDMHHMHIQDALKIVDLNIIYSFLYYSG